MLKFDNGKYSVKKYKNQLWIKNVTSQHHGNPWLDFILVYTCKVFTNILMCFCMMQNTLKTRLFLKPTSVTTALNWHS